MTGLAPHDWIGVALRVCVTCSVLHSFLPPWDFLDQFPTAQKYYKVMIYVIGYVALNGRSTVYKSISTGNGNGNAKPDPTPPAAPPKQ